MSAAQSPEEPPIFISAEQAAKKLNLHKETIYLLCDAQKIKSKYHGRRRLIYRDSVDEYADSLPIYPSGRAL